MKRFSSLLLIIMSVMLSGCGNRETAVTGLTVEMLENPIGISTPQPRFCWRIESRRSDIVQTGYRIVVAGNAEDLKNGDNLLWDTGLVESDRTLFIPYEGPALESRKSYFWRVMVATGDGLTLWSDTAGWSMALMKESDWSAQWIGIDAALNPTDRLTGDTRLAARYLRKEFTADKKVASARLYISGLGLYECYINGKRIGKEEIFTPALSDYTRSVNYNTYDVTSLLGHNNTIGVILGNGRFFSMREGNNKHFGFPKLLAQLEITYADGSRSTIVSDSSWRLTTNGPVVANSEFDGEEYDARLEMNGWSENGFDDSSWIQAQRVEAPGGRLVAQTNPDIRTMDEVTPVAIHRLNDSTLILDMGQNMVGWLSVTLKGKKDRQIRMRFAETLQPDGSLYLANIRGARVTDIYTPAADGRFSWQPRFTYHGFRFVEITGLDYTPELSAFRGKVNYDRMQNVGTFQCSDTTLNSIYGNAFRGIRGNYRSMPTDCPQRDERMGWLGDRAMGCIGESFIFRQLLLYEKWLRDIEESQNDEGCIPDVAPAYWAFYSGNVTWPAAYICVADMLYGQYGDIRPICEHYPSMKRWMEFIRDTRMDNGIVYGDIYGDWCMPPEAQELIHSQDPARRTDGRLLGTSFYYRLLGIMCRFAALSGNEADIPEYRELAEKVKKAYNATFLDAETGRYANNTVTANLCSLMQGLVPDSLRERVFENIVDKTRGEFDSHISTGLIGIQFLMRGLTRNGQPELAYTIATNHTYPSWGYMLDNGATTIWELWNGDTADPAMNSGNHVMLLGDLMTWYYEDLAGIKSGSGTDGAGFRKTVMEPCFPERLDWVKASYESLHGTIVSNWTKTADALEWDIEIPANTTASIRIPAASADDVTESGAPLSQNRAVKSIAYADGFARVEVGSGHFRFKAVK